MLAFEIFYVSLMSVIGLYGVHRYWLALGTRRARAEEPAPIPPGDPGAAVATVLVQLPIYNERPVVLRLLDSAAGLDWPRERLEIQVLDDSDDGSEALVAARVAEWRQQGARIEHVRRGDRTGYKAGALEVGLEASDARYVAMFDADFVIPADFLQRTIGFLESDERLGMVQARWGFLNAGHSLLTRIQGLLLDGHFHVEHRARAAAGRFFNFNGTAGVWRRATIDDAGGWRAETITEDLDLSLRAWLRGWRFRYLDDLEVPSALPEAMPAFKVQQNRWVSGSVQTLKQLLGRILGSSLRTIEKIDLMFYLTGNCVYFLLLLLALSVPPAVLLRFDTTGRVLLWADIPFFLVATGSVFAFYSRARRPEVPWLTFLLLRIPALMGLGLGMTLHNTRAILRGLFGRSRVFERTPKGGAGHERAGVRSERRRRVDLVPFLEPMMGAYVLVCLVISVTEGSRLSIPFSLPFLGLFVWGYFFVSYRTFRR